LCVGRVCVVCDAEKVPVCVLAQLGVGAAAGEDGNPAAWAPMLVDAEVLNGEHVLMVAAGKHHTAAVTEEGGLWAWGQGKFGALGIPHSSQDHSAPQCIQAQLLGGERVVMVACGNAHTATLTEAGLLFLWGLNGNGQCGSDKTDTILAPACVPPHRFAGHQV
jgi:alpha-tubulin suppressor-like RCC1 family protein